jgi:HD-GYP domain-containing protein (c-di-GMP phosphodiesterase class II)/pSer/pThr/pTyr-binding forkhead associated (FHA) protein
MMHSDHKANAYLIIERGNAQGTRIKLTGFPIQLGRDSSSDVALEDDEVSRCHARIKQRGRLFIIEDRESRNGTYVNGDRILNSILKSGDKVLLGATELTFISSSSQIELTSDIINFNMVVGEELGIKGPISVMDCHDEKEFLPLRINPHGFGGGLSSDSDVVRQLFDLQGNMLVIDQLEEACSSFLKCILKLSPSANRAALFSWSEEQKQLIPLAARHKKKRQKFLLSQRALEDVVARKQITILMAKNTSATQGGTSRIVMPMTMNDRNQFILHIEVDDPTVALPNRELEIVNLFIARSAPTFESLMLRRDLDGWMIGMVDTIISTIEANDTYTRGHSERVSKYSMAIADELRLNVETKRLLMVSAMVHDVGKIGVSDNILKKAGILTAEEYEEMKLHPSIGADICSHIPNAKRFISGVKHHHEKWDGTGYPDGLMGENIPFFARIVAISDVFDAMVSGRSYSGFIDQGDAIQRLNEEIEIFDPEILKAFTKAYESGAISLKTSTQNKTEIQPFSEDPQPPSSDDIDHGGND